MFTTDHLVDYTYWTTEENGGFEKNFDSFYDDEMTNLYLQFEVYFNNDINDDTTNPPAAAWSDEANAVRCLVCMNVDENSELRAGDKGFAACYRPFTGSFFEDYENVLNTAGTVTLNYDNPEWVFLGEVKAVNKGEAVKATGKNGWLETFTWNTHKDDLDTLCSVSGYTVSGEANWLFPYHESKINDYTDYIGLVSEDGFKNTGLNAGENHLKCWFKSHDSVSFSGSEYYNKDWEPDFEGDDGQSLAGWVSTGTA